MATTASRLYKGTLTSSNATLYTVPSNTTAIVKAITLCNITAVAKTVTIKLAGTEIINAYTIGAYDTIVIPFIDQVVLTTELIEGSASANSAVNVYISGKLIT